MSGKRRHHLPQFLQRGFASAADCTRTWSVAILKRTAKFDYEELSDEELTAAAARVFELLDQEEDDAASR